ncbi:MAG: zinc ribbon domain-containing protein [Deltaproteobacteria bacterium]|jgi:predicted nucleic acid-binding Zn ribbon protein|nr:zinc ribbon domain-containing protein [Deltaproteobacteria bacterium]
MYEFEKPLGYKKLESLRCKRCGKMVSENDKICPYCGQIYPSQEKSSSRVLIYIFSIIVILIGGYYYLESSDDSGKRKAIRIVRNKIKKSNRGSYRFAVDKIKGGYLVDFNNGLAKYRVIKGKVCAINIKAKKIAPSVKMCSR